MPPTDAPNAPRIERLLERFRRREAEIGVIGLGYVGLPLAAALATAGFAVTGFDIDPAKAAALKAGRSYIRHVPAERISPLMIAGKLTPTTDFGPLADMDAILICVPTPLNRHREPDLSFVENTAREVAARLRPGQLVVLESTTYPGTCREVMKPILEAGGLVSGRDFFLAFSPEREDPGNSAFTTAEIPKIVGAEGDAALSLACALYEQFVAGVAPVSSLEAAEAVKLTENIFRSVNIALVNELKVIYDSMGIDVWEVIEAAKTKPFGYMAFYPGPGLGGHCIPIDPFYLTWKAREFGISTRFIELAGEINTRMPHYVVGKLAEALDRRQQRALSASRVLVLGLAYKKNVDDIRESASLRLIEMLEARGAEVGYFDPYVPEIPPTREHAGLQGRRSLASLDDLSAFDAVLIATDHDDVDYAAVVRQAPLVLDTRNVCERKGLWTETVVKA